MSNKKRLYLNGCSFIDSEYILNDNSPLCNIFYKYGSIEQPYASIKTSVGGHSNEAIFRRTYIDILKNDFDFVIISWSHPERYFITDLANDIDYNILKEESDKQIGSHTYKDRIMYGYEGQIPYHTKNGNEILKFEPKGTDDTIFYTLSLHQLLKLKGIPHIFLNMGKLDEKVLFARESWIKFIDSKNYFSINPIDSILEKMKFSYVEYLQQLTGKEMIKDVDIMRLKKENNIDNVLDLKTDNPYVRDLAGHPSELGYDLFCKDLYDFIIKENLV